MKISYLVSEAFIKPIDKLKAQAEKRLTADQIRAEAKKMILEPILTDTEFLRKCGNCFKTFIHVNANTTPPGVLNFRYISLENGVLTVDCDAHYTGNASQRNHATAKSVLIEDSVINKYTVEEMSDEIDAYCTKYLWQYFKKTKPEILDYINKIHIERINLWSNCPESMNGVFPGKLAVRLSSEYYGKKVLSESELVELFVEKINRLFSFCATEVVLDKTEVKLTENPKVQIDVDNILNANKESRQHQEGRSKYAGVSYQMNDSFDKNTISKLSRKNLHEYLIASEDKKIDLKKFITSKDVEDSIVKRTLNPWINDARIITTADLKEVTSIKDDLCFLLNNANSGGIYRSTTGKNIPDPSTGFIEYLAYVCEHYSNLQGKSFCYTVLDYIDGEYHDFYKIEIY